MIWWYYNLHKVKFNFLKNIIMVNEELEKATLELENSNIEELKEITYEELTKEPCTIKTKKSKKANNYIISIIIWFLLSVILWFIWLIQWSIIYFNIIYILFLTLIFYILYISTKKINILKKWRYNRSKYWINLLTSVLLIFLLSWILAFIWTIQQYSIYIVYVSYILIIILNIYLIIYSLLNSARRLNDMNKNSWFCLLILIPYIWFLIQIIWLWFFKWTKWPNKYWNNPLESKKTTNIKNSEL